MAVTCTSRIASGDDTNSKTYTVGSFAYQNNTLYTLAIQTSTTNQSPTSIVGGGLTWVEVTNEPFNTIATPAARLSVWRALVTSGASTGTLTITFSATASRCCWCLDEWSGMDTSGTNGSGAIVQSNVNRANAGATSLTVTLSSGIGAGNASYGAFGRNVRSAYTHGTNYTDLGTGQGASEANSVYTEYRSAGDTTPNASFSSSAVGGIGIEILAGTPPSVTGTADLVVVPVVAATATVINPVTSTASLTISPAVVAAGAESLTSTAALTIVPAVVAAGQEKLTATGALTIVPAVTAAGAESLTSTAALTVTPVVEAAAEVTGGGPPSVTSTAALTITPSVEASATATEAPSAAPLLGIGGGFAGGGSGAPASKVQREIERKVDELIDSLLTEAPSEAPPEPPAPPAPKPAPVPKRTPAPIPERIRVPVMVTEPWTPPAVQPEPWLLQVPAIETSDDAIRMLLLAAASSL